MGQPARIPTYDELMALGDNDQAPAAAASTSAPPAASSVPTFDQLMAVGKEIPSASTGAAPKAAPSAVDNAIRQAALTARNLGPYAFSSAVGAAGGTLLGPGPGTMTGAVLGPVAFGLTDLISTGYNAVGPRFGLPRMTTATEAVDILADKIGLPRPETPTEKIAQATERSITGATGIINAANRAIPLVTNPTTQGVLTTLASNPGAQVAGATGGALLPSIAREKFDVGNGKYGPLIDMGLGVTGSLLGGGVTMGLSNIRGNNFANPETARLITAARNAGVDLSAAEVAPNSFSGTTIQGLRRAGNVVDDRANVKANQIVNMVESSTEGARPPSVPVGASADRAVAVDIRNQYGTAKRTAGQLYDAVDTALASQPGTDRLTLANTQTTAAQLVSQFPEWATLTNASTAMRSRLDSIVNGTSNRPSTILGPNGQPVMVPPQTTFGDMRALSKEVGQLVEATRTDPKLASIHGQIKQLYGAIQTDADTWATTTPNTKAAQAYGAAQSFFKDNVVPFRESPVLYRVASSRAGGDFDKRAENLTQSILSSGPETTSLTAKLLSPEGQAAFRFKIMEDARGRAINPDAATIFSSPAYQRTMALGRADTPSPQRTVMGTDPSVLQSVEQNQAIIDAARGNSVTSKAAPRTGVQLLPTVNRVGASGAGYGLAGLLGLDPTMGAVVGALSGPAIASGAERFMTSPTMTNFLLSQSYQPGAGLLAPMLNRTTTAR